MRPSTPNQNRLRREPSTPKVGVLAAEVVAPAYAGIRRLFIWTTFAADDYAEPAPLRLGLAPKLKPLRQVGAPGASHTAPKK
jgi:hypothetical protein